MKFSLRNKTVDELLWHKKVGYAVIAFLAVSNCLLSILAFRQKEKWVLIPQYNPSHRVVVTNDGYSDEYMSDFADAALRNLLTVNANTVDRHAKMFAEFSYNTNDVNIFLKKHQAFIKEHDATSAFYPKTFKVDREQETIAVTGDLHYRFGSKRDVISSTKTFTLTYHQGTNGLFFIKGLKEDSCDA